MNKYVALFRGLNVGGHNKITMVELRVMLEAADCQKVTTYIQSGNAVFVHDQPRDKIETMLEGAFEKHFEYRVDIVVRTEAELASATTAYPFFSDERNLSFMMTGFARQPIGENAISILEQVAIDGELVEAKEQEIHFYFGNGSGRSKLGALNFAKKIGTPITMRNRRTVLKLLELINAL
ncbi:DUF1697 domain-containing protein [Maritalea sp.]|jgi:uncharacterized protein (DUF1697 family)|uniref:DUF1697 domain-containing protein n=1 Tax=Maritalea sp. TaxID=2003361 RepID=UPI0039E535D2